MATVQTPRSSDRAATSSGACTPCALSQLGPLLCLHPASDPHLLSGWTRASRSFATVGIDSDGPSEGICFLDDTGACCWLLQRLPDSDFLGWERLMSLLPAATVPLARRAEWSAPWPDCLSTRWRSCAVRLHALAERPGTARLAATDVRLSGIGADCAMRLARRARASMHPGGVAG